MKIKLLIMSLIFIGLIISECAIGPPPPPPVSKLGPDVRIGIAEKLETISFETDDDIDILDQEGRVLANNFPGRRWRVQLVDGAAVNLKYRLLYREVSHPEVAARLATSLEERGHPVVIQKIKKKMFLSTNFGYAFCFNIFLTPVFDSEEEAIQYQKHIGDQLSTTILPFFDARPKGRVILINEDTGESFQSPGLIRVRGHFFTLKVLVGAGYHFERKERRTYRSQLEFWIDRFGKLTIVNEIPLEIYLKGVVGSEMSSQFPLEALKAQAVTARCYTLAWIGKEHRLSPFDLCDEVHCHVYGGVDRESPLVNEAVERTRGQVLMYGGRICDTRYASVCGGHTENNENVWYNEPQPYLRGHLDSRLIHLLPKDYLNSGSRVRQWIETSPDVYCNAQRKSVPDYLNYTRKYFRWSVRYSREELSNIIAEKTGQNIGTLFEIIPLERGVSGRLKKVELRGTRKTIIIEKELEIRKALSPNYLYSSCFVVDREGHDFILKGAGWGHGVGMCQTGAAMMALEGFRYREILNHYYLNSKIIKLY